MEKLYDLYLDYCPDPIYRGIDKLRSLPKEIKWKRKRAKGVLPECDLWEFKYTLADCLIQGMEYLLRENGVRDWKTRYTDREEYSDYRFILNTMKQFKYYNDHYVHFTKTKEEAMLAEAYKSTDLIVYMTDEEWKLFEKQLYKCFKYVAKHMWSMWD